MSNGMIIDRNEISHEINRPINTLPTAQLWRCGCRGSVLNLSTSPHGGTAGVCLDLSKDWCQCFVFNGKYWVLVHLGGISPTSRPNQGKRGREGTSERLAQEGKYGCNYSDAHVLRKYDSRFNYDLCMCRIPQTLYNFKKNSLRAKI